VYNLCRAVRVLEDPWKTASGLAFTLLHSLGRFIHQ
jgi:hypothetical protein